MDKGQAPMENPPPIAIDADQLRFELLSKDDLPQIRPLENEAYPDPWTQGMFLQEISNGTSHFYLAFYEDELVAYGGFWLILDEVHITKVTVAHARRRAGLGAAFMGFLERLGRKLGGTVVRLEVRESNLAARTLYERAGYEEIGIRKRYYAATGEDAIVMAKLLEPLDESTPS